MNEIREEIEAIQAIYCGQEEFETHKAAVTDHIFTVTIKSGEEDSNEHVSVSITFTITAEYPDSIPEFSLTSKYLTRRQCETLKADLICFTQDLTGEPMLMDIITWVQHNAISYGPKYEEKAVLKPPSEGSKLVTCLLRLDHMRAKVKYTKTIQKWTEELGLTGKLIFFEKLILILLQGLQSDVKEYIQRQKTVNVDVDSKGRNCKERMLSIVTEEALDQRNRFSDFKVVEYYTVDQLKALFTSSSLDNLYLVHVMPLFRR